MLDPRTILALDGIAHLLQVVALAVQYRVNRTYSGIGWWLAWSAAVAAGFGFSLARGRPGFVVPAILGQNVLIALGVGLLYVGVARFLGSPVRWAVLVTLLGTYAAAQVALLVGVDSFLGRSILISVLLAAVALLTAWELRAARGRGMATSARFLTAVLLLHALFHGGRAVALPFTGMDTGFFTPSAGASLMLVEGFVAGNLLTIGVILMANQRAHSEMVEARDHFRLLFETSPDAVTITRLEDGKLLDTNEGFEALTGYRREEVRGDSAARVGLYADLAARGAIVARLRETGACTAVETVFRRKDGSLMIGSLSARVVPLRGELHVLSVTRDVTERKRAEEELARSAREIQELNVGLEARVALRTAELRAANRELEALVHSIAHDLRAPLRAIDGFTAILEADHVRALAPDGRLLLGRVRAAAQKMDRLIRDLIEHASVGSARLRPGPVDMTALARAALAEAALPEVVATFRVTLPELPEAYGDPALLRLALRHLLSNAVKYSLPKPERWIEVGGRIEGDRVVYRVADGGVGFDPAHAGKLFGMFQRLHGSDAFDGTGIGLAIVKRIAARHGGGVRAEGAVDEGAAFSLELPLGGMADA